MRVTVAMLLLLCGGFAAAETLQAIRFAGNDTTRPEVMLQEMSIGVGDPLDLALIEDSRQAIMDLGLFKAVRAELLQEPEGAALLITVEEKWYILPIPRVGVRADGEADYGMELRFDNLFGLNQRFKLEYITKDSVTTDAPLRRELFVGYTYPRIIGTPYQLDVSAGHVTREQRQLDDGGEEIGLYRQDSRSLRLGLYRWQRVSGPSRGWRYGGGIGLQQEVYQHLDGAAVPYQDASNVQVNALVEFVDVREEQYRRRGRAYGYSIELGVPQLADFSYNRHLLYYRRYLPLDDQRSNINYRFQLGLANGEAFGSRAWSLGGSTSLRGYEGGYVAGNAMLLNNIEYLFPLSGYRQLRGVLFSDIGSAWPGVMEMDLGDLKVSAGVGLRWKVQLFVDVTIRLDFAWGLEPETQMTYLETSTMF